VSGRERQVLEERLFREGGTVEPIRVGINGFGRIGRCVFKQLRDDDRFRVAGINDLSDLEDLAYLCRHDSVHGPYHRPVAVENGRLTVDGRAVPFYGEKSPAQIPWRDEEIDIVIESTGAFRGREDAGAHLEAGARRVIISAPSSDADATLCYGVNEDIFDPDKHQVVSAASCTTNCLAPVARVLLDAFGIEHLLITTVHAYTSSQSLMDTPARKRRRGRAAGLSVVPTTTGAARATGVVIPELKGRLDGLAMRVPVPDGSITDVVARLERDVTADEVNQALQAASETQRLRGILRVTDEELVSRDVIGDTHSCTVDASSTLVLRDRAVKLLAWYDNEWGYAARLVDLAALLAGAEGTPSRPRT
jgi:glyceraldehyde-3-phosphate dehydrogenase type I